MQQEGLKPAFVGRTMEQGAQGRPRKEVVGKFPTCRLVPRCASVLEAALKRTVCRETGSFLPPPPVLLSSSLSPLRFPFLDPPCPCASPLLVLVPLSHSPFPSPPLCSPQSPIYISHHQSAGPNIKKPKHFNYPSLRSPRDSSACGF